MNERHELELKSYQLRYLEEMARKHELPDASKALRCLIMFARQRPELEEVIFETIRCSDC